MSFAAKEKVHGARNIQISKPGFTQVTYFTISAMKLNDMANFLS